MFECALLEFVLGGGATYQCPSALEVRAWIDQRMRWLSAEFGSDRMRSARVVLPTREHLPDRYSGGKDDAWRVLDRVCGWMGIAPESVELSLYRDDRLTCEDGWLRRTSGPYQDEGEVRRIWIEVTNWDDPLSTVATCAHELAHVLLLGRTGGST